MAIIQKLQEIMQAMSFAAMHDDPVLPYAVLSRPVDQEQEEEERRMLQRSWEMAVILDFLERFRPHLSLSRGFTVHELESVLILSPGGEGLLGSLHMVRAFLPWSDHSCG